MNEHAQPQMYPVHPAQQRRNAWLESMRPLRENFETDEDFEEALSGFNHRIVPLLRPIPFKDTTPPVPVDDCPDGQ